VLVVSIYLLPLPCDFLVVSSPPATGASTFPFASSTRPLVSSRQVVTQHHYTCRARHTRRPVVLTSAKVNYTLAFVSMRFACRFTAYSAECIELTTCNFEFLLTHSHFVNPSSPALVHPCPRPPHPNFRIIMSYNIPLQHAVSRNRHAAAATRQCRP
jgi:hypothetical protein